MDSAFEGSSLGLVRGEVALVPSDPSWAVTYERVVAYLWSALQGIAVGIEHVGSTAVPGLPAKPILDIAVGVPASLDPSVVVEPLEALGFLLRGSDESDVQLNFGWEDTPRHRLVNLHVVVHEGRRWRDYLTFRDRLRADRVARDRYASLKSELAARHPSDRIAYVDGKDAFVAGILAGH